MLSKLSKNSDPKRILIVSQTNIGDAVLTCPVIDILRRDFPRAKIDIVTGPKAVSLFGDNPDLVAKVFDKQAPLGKKFEWFLDLYHTHYDCVVDLRRTALALFLLPRYATPVITGRSFSGHKKDAHLNRLRQVYPFDDVSSVQYAVLTSKEDEQFLNKELFSALSGQGFVVIAPGAADSAKRWHTPGFAQVADHLSAKYKIIFVGDAKDVPIVKDIQGRMRSPSMSLAGKINLRQLAFVLKKCRWVITHDSGVMHLASYINVPLVALWGPTDINKYAPWGKRSEVVRRNEKCPRCLDPKSKSAHNCMSFIEVQDVIKAADAMASQAKRS
jgi:ADP-heptose:LPS heptosyltransferase